MNANKRIQVELLAPAGKEGSVDAVLEAGADAVYLGGKCFNMRHHFRRFNFSDDVLARQIERIHDAGAQAYVVVNSLLAGHELDPVADYLRWLVDAGADAVILQDLAILQLAAELDLDIPLHASTMMNVHSEETARELADLGVARIIASRDITLETVRAIHLATGLEVEYFVHGDMCIAQSGQCHHSGVLGGKSANRGQCMKACRWQWELIDAASGEVRATDERGAYLLARRDMAMYFHLPAVISAGVCSLKIEGRMRSAEFLGKLVAAYRRALDSYLADPAGYDIDPDEWRKLHEDRIRDFSTCNAFCSPGLPSIATDGEREPRFFSKATVEIPMEVESLPSWQPHELPSYREVTLAVRVADEASAAAALESGAERILAGGEIPRDRAGPWSLAALRRLHEMVQAKNGEWGLLTPRIAERRQIDDLFHQLAHLEETPPAGVAVHTLGTLRLVREAGLTPWADLSFNVLNARAARLLAGVGAEQLALAPEAGFADLAEVVDARVPVECHAHGPISAMVLDYCVVAALELGMSREDPCPAPCFEGRRALRDTAGGVHEVLLDQHCRGTLLMSHDLGLLPLLDRLCAEGVRVIRLNLHDTPAERVGPITALYRRHLDRCLAHLAKPCPLPQREWEELQNLSTRPLNSGAYQRGVSPQNCTSIVPS